MNDPLPRFSTRVPWLSHTLDRWRAGLHHGRRLVGKWVSEWVCPGRLATAVRGPVGVGVSLQAQPWQVVMVEPFARAHAGADARLLDDAAQGLQHRPWRPELLPDMWAAKHLTADSPEDDLQRAAWWSALEGLRALLPLEACHLVLSWPDEALWSTTITLSGPFTPTELPSLLLQELAAVMPVDVERTAWDVRAPANAPLPSTQPGWQGWLRSMPGMGWAGATPIQGDGDITVQVWAMPRSLAQHLDAMARELGFASMTLEPGSVSLTRAQAQLARGSGDSVRHETRLDVPEVAIAWGAACRQDRQGPDLLRRLPAQRWRGWRRRAREWWPWLLVLGVTLGAGHAMGGWQLDHWLHERAVWQQRLRQLQSRQDTQAQQQRAMQQAHTEQQQQAERFAHNLRFVQVLHGWAATLPDGVRWQQISLRPQRIELHGQALDAERMSRWMDRWPQTLPAGVQHHLQWQPAVEGAVGKSTDAGLGLSVELSWGTVGGGRE